MDIDIKLRDLEKKQVKLEELSDRLRDCTRTTKDIEDIKKELNEARIIC